MAGSSLLAPRLVKGAFIRLDVTGIGITPQIIAFQYNAESITRKFKPYEKPQDKEGDKPDLNAQMAPYDPTRNSILRLNSTPRTLSKSRRRIPSLWQLALPTASRQWRCCFIRRLTWVCWRPQSPHLPARWASTAARRQFRNDESRRSYCWSGGQVAWCR